MCADIDQTPDSDQPGHLMSVPFITRTDAAGPTPTISQICFDAKLEAGALHCVL
jgi:hypothetical protein